jgi:hypothetical protein
VNPLSSEEAHFVDTCYHIPGREHQGKLEQTESETVEKEKETLWRPSRQPDALWKS